jgi:hypothetical protein
MDKETTRNMDKVKRVFTRGTPLVYTLHWSLVQLGTCLNDQLKPALKSNTTTGREFLNSGSPEKTQRHMTLSIRSRVHENLKYKFNSDTVMRWRLHRVWSGLRYKGKSEYKKTWNTSSTQTQSWAGDYTKYDPNLMYTRKTRVIAEALSRLDGKEMTQWKLSPHKR